MLTKLKATPVLYDKMVTHVKWGIGAEPSDWKDLMGWLWTLSSA